MTHPAFTPKRTAVVTGGASGIGLATAERLVAMGLNVCIADHDEEQLGSAADTLAKQCPRGADAILAAPVDVARLESVQALLDAVLYWFGEGAVLRRRHI